MNWFYVLNGYRAGPVTASELIQLLARRTLTPGTPIWREGMADWQPYREIARKDSDLAMGLACHHCGRPFPPEQLVVLEGLPICPACQPILRQQMRDAEIVRLDAVRQRQNHLKHEASLKAVALLYLLLAVALAFLSYKWPGLAASYGFGGRRLALWNGWISRALLLFGILQFWAGLSLYRLRPGARISVGMAAVIGLLGFPFGTVFSSYVLYLVFSTQGRFVLSPTYRQIIDATPNLRYRTTARTWVGLAILMGLLGVLAWGFFSGQ